VKTKQLIIPLPPTVETKAVLSRNRYGSEGAFLPIFIQSVYSFPVIVPVVQRREQGFPKAKTVFLQKFADVVSSSQTAIFREVE
jgi:hypothetical protein